METVMAAISTAVKRELQDDKTNASQPLSNAADCEIDSKGAIDPTDLNSQAKLRKKSKPTRAARRLKAMQKHLRRAKEKENIQLAEKRAEVEKQIADVISVVQADIQNLVEAEKRKSVQYLSLARKYYSMWKTLNDERSRQKRTCTSKMKQTSPQENDSTFDVSVLKEQNFPFPLPMTSMTMNERFSENASSEDKFQLLGETLNVSSGVSTK